MKKYLFFCVGLIAITKSIFAQFETKLNEELFITKLSETIYLVTHYFPRESNSLIVKASDKEVVLIDTPYDKSASALMMNWFQNSLKPEKVAAIILVFCS